MKNKKCGLVALLGLPNAGKSTILNSLVGQKLAPVSVKPQTTRQSIRGIVTRENNQLIFVDTPGLLEAKQELQSFMRKQALSASNDVDVLVWVTDAAHVLNKASFFARDEEQIAEIFKRVDKKRPIVWVCNKVDQVEDKNALLPLIEEKSKKFDFAAVLPVSAKQGDGLDGIVAEVVKHLPESEFLFDPEMVTDAVEKNLVADLIREKVLTELGEEIPHQIAVTIENFNESRRQNKKKPIVEISAVLHVERDSQKKIVIGKKGAKIKAIGVKSRPELEELLQCQVMLNLLVRVEPDWSKSVKGLKKLGYL